MDLDRTTLSGGSMNHEIAMPMRWRCELPSGAATLKRRHIHERQQQWPTHLSGSTEMGQYESSEQPSNGIAFAFGGERAKSEGRAS